MSTAAPVSPEGFDAESSADPLEMSFEKFLEWEAEEGHRVEWVNGRVEFSAPVRTEDNTLALFLATLLCIWAEERAGGGAVFAQRVLMRLPPYERGPIKSLGTARIPDVMYISRANEGRIEEYYVNGPADIVIDIISSDRRWRSLEATFFEYNRAGVKEYWVIDLAHNYSVFHRLNGNDRYERAKLENGSIYHSAVLPGFTLDVNWLNQRPLPTLMSVLKTWALV